ncbi:HK97 family phage prohead protease [Tenggerimyces flavus]|uniref:HK97 family phage prohead protease n=1 Tax=Tenggerimyces flavus TaxID=1708749 RepID=A0ABV7YA50_9ACTN|nr:HK97 family phage prohead protease [Tenggerimyces flavus]MBM7788861.1 hypothetical protein [Tenggerimyces flavus]
MSIKHLGQFEIKNASKGEVTAVFSTFNVVDKDGDVTIPGAFTDGQEVLISAYGHKVWEGALPVGKGIIRQTDSEAILDGKFFLDTDDGRNTFNVIKNVGARQEWSYGYDILDAAPGKFGGTDVQFLKQLNVTEVSPVLIGAGVNTRTLAAKSAQGQQRQQETTMSAYKRAIRPHETPVAAKAWHGVEVHESAAVGGLRHVYAWVDGDPEQKASYRFPHHENAVGPANVRACLLGIAQLNSVKGAGIPAEDRQAVYEHLAGHLRDNDSEPPELLAAPTSTMKFNDEGISVIADVSAFIDRATEVIALRSAKGRTPLSAGSADLFEWLGDELQRLKSLLDTPDEELAREYVRFVQSQLRRAS